MICALASTNGNAYGLSLAKFWDSVALLMQELSIAESQKLVESWAAFCGLSKLFN